jgi:hypothetical protein
MRCTQSEYYRQEVAQLGYRLQACTSLGKHKQIRQIRALRKPSEPGSYRAER